MDAHTNKFTYDFHLASHDDKQVIDKGATDYTNFVDAFEKFPWLEQIDEMNRTGKTSPTISVHAAPSSTSLWVSVMGDSNSYGYLIGYNYPKTQKGLLGFGKEKQITWVEMRLTEDKSTVFKCYELFFKEDTPGLIAELKKLELYGETAAD